MLCQPVSPGRRVMSRYHTVPPQALVGRDRRPSARPPPAPSGATAVRSRWCVWPLPGFACEGPVGKASRSRAVGNIDSAPVSTGERGRGHSPPPHCRPGRGVPLGRPAGIVEMRCRMSIIPKNTALEPVTQRPLQQPDVGVTVLCWQSPGSDLRLFTLRAGHSVAYKSLLLLHRPVCLQKHSSTVNTSRQTQGVEGIFQ